MPCDSNSTLLLSIVTVCRNDAKRLKLTINSLSDFYRDSRFEHVVVDGESTDDTNFLMASMSQMTSFKFYSSRDAGIYDAMNRGVEFSKAPLLLFLNCGDTFIATPNEISAYLNRWLNIDNRVNLDIACFPVREMGDKEARTARPTLITKHKMPVSHQGMVFTREFIQRNKYDVSYKIAGDYDLYLRASRIMFPEHTDAKALVCVEAEGLASGNPWKSYREYLKIAYCRLQGPSRIVALLLIGIRAVCVISIKIILPKRWVAVLRGI